MKIFLDMSYKCTYFLNISKQIFNLKFINLLFLLKYKQWLSYDIFWTLLLILPNTSNMYVFGGFTTLNPQVTCLPQPTDRILFRIQGCLSNIFIAIFRTCNCPFSIQYFRGYFQLTLQHTRAKAINFDGSWILY